MIETKDDLRACLRKECKKECGFVPFVFCCVKMYLRGDESLPKYEVLHSLRKYEYYTNKRKRGIIDGLKGCFWHFLFRNRQLRHSMFIEPNTLGEGAVLMHPGFRKIPDFVQIGKNSTILPMVLIGRKKPGIEGKAIIGDNCYISTGVTILAPVNIGDNVVIGAGAVVTKDIPSNTVFAGVPAKMINEVV